MSALKSATEIATEYEARLLGSLLLNPDQFDDVSDIVGFDDLISEIHVVVFQSIAALREAKEAVHALSVFENLSRSTTLQSKTTPITLPLLQALASQASHGGARSDAKKVRERAALRRLHSAGERIQELAGSATASPEAIVEEITQLVEVTSATVSARGPMIENFVPYERAMSDYLTKLDAQANNPQVTDGILTGIEDVDAYLGTLGPGYHILAGRPGAGKTALMLQIASHAYETTERDGNHSVSSLLFSTDMLTETLMRRLLAQRSGVDFRTLRTGQLTDTDWSLVTKAISDMQALSMWIDPTKDLTTTDVTMRMKRFMREKKTRNGLVILDYIQKVSPPMGARIGNSNPGEYVSKHMEALAKENGLIFLVLAQLNRSGEQRTNKRPVLSDLKGASQLEQDADSVHFLFRDEKAPGIVEFITAKNREGEQNNTIDLGFAGAKQRFFQVEQRTVEERMGTPREEMRPAARQGNQSRGFSPPSAQR